MTAVTPMPVRSPAILRSVSFPRSVRSWPPALPLQGLSHNAHAEQEQAQSADKSQHIENIHKADFLSLLVSRFYSNKCM